MHGLREMLNNYENVTLIRYIMGIRSPSWVYGIIHVQFMLKSVDESSNESMDI